MSKYNFNDAEAIFNVVNKKLSGDLVGYYKRFDLTIDKKEIDLWIDFLAKHSISTKEECILYERQTSKLPFRNRFFFLLEWIYSERLWWLPRKQGENYRNILIKYFLPCNCMVVWIYECEYDGCLVFFSNSGFKEFKKECKHNGVCESLWTILLIILWLIFITACIIGVVHLIIS